VTMLCQPETVLSMISSRASSTCFSCDSAELSEHLLQTTENFQWIHSSASLIIALVGTDQLCNNILLNSSNLFIYWQHKWQIASINLNIYQLCKQKTMLLLLIRETNKYHSVLLCYCVAKLLIVESVIEN